ncbi:VOC family protein [Parasphingorhabdus halotolerans]|uniref:VOC family protein n=1 Tax=Parasphingorhabdus halotolerans TaxID=2725558 RepID=A0A6H2DLS9_9SPHN|nr:VOC family protein [Parasphingorhabdus halotolerans]QJB69632.1 VOC family protein [Parasphingorhabdus halotolerans]
MPNKHGDFIWYELMTNDADAAQDFYGAVLGWDFADSGQTGMDYRQISMKGNDVGGVMPLTPEMTAGGAQPCWRGYINVEDVDRMAEAITSAGGNVFMDPQDIGGVGRFAYVADPQGAMFYVMKPTPPADNPDATSMAFAATEPMVGHCAWNELATSDQDAAINFYHDLFGWEQKDEMDMGPMGSYKFFHHGPGMIGAVMTKPDEMPVSAWTYYFRVADIDEAVKAIRSNGGQITLEPSEIPGGEFQLNAMDPQGAAFALVGARH